MPDNHPLALEDYEREWSPVTGPNRAAVEEERKELTERLAVATRWWIDRWRLPAPDGRADRVAVHLLRRLVPNRAAALVAAALPKLAATSSSYRAERVIRIDEWRRVCAIATPQVVSDYLDARSRSGRILLLVLEALLTAASAKFERVIVSHVPQAVALFPHEVEPDGLKEFPKLIERIGPYLERHERRPAVEAAWQAWIRPLIIGSSLRYDSRRIMLVGSALRADLVREFLQDADQSGLIAWNNQGLIGSAVRIAPELMLPRFKALWAARTDWNTADHTLGTLLTSALHSAADAVFDTLGVEVGFEAAAADRGADPSDSARLYVGEFLHVHPVPTIPHDVIQQTYLWSLLRRLKSYERWPDPPELRGVRRELASFIEDDPTAWTRALPHILARIADIPDAESLTTVAAHRTPAVRAALEVCARDGPTMQVGDRAKGILATLDGFARPGAELADELLAFAARELDGTPIFPHPLAVRGATWIADAAAESLLREGIDRATHRFAAYFRDQGPVEEEAVTSHLLAELEIAFRETEARAGKLSAASGTPIGLVERRQVPKYEEKQIGCDLALLVRADVGKVFRATWAEFVQVKKPERRGARFVDQWRITLETQLDDLLRTSPTSAYWLIGAAGEVFVVPAKILLGVKRGREARGKTMTVSYRLMRSAAIPLSQFILDLLAGAWIGSTDEATVRIARGEDRGFRPREVFEIRVHVGKRG